jgi:hypothetical protein
LCTIGYNALNLDCAFFVNHENLKIISIIGGIAIIVFAFTQIISITKGNSFSERERIKVASLPLQDNHLLSVSIGKREAHHDKLIENLVKIISYLTRQH